MKLLLGLLGLYVSVSALANPPASRVEQLKVQDYAWHWSLTTPINSSAYLLRLTPEIYRSLATDHLEDLAVFNAAGQRLPLGSLPDWMMPPEQLAPQQAEFSVKRFPRLPSQEESSEKNEVKIPTIKVEVKHGQSATTVQVENPSNHQHQTDQPLIPPTEQVAERGPPLRLNDNGRARVLYPELAVTIEITSGNNSEVEEFQIKWSSDLAPRGYWRLSALDTNDRRIAAQMNMLDNGNAIEGVAKLTAPGIESRRFLLEAFHVPESFQILNITAYTRHSTQFASQEWATAELIKNTDTPGEFIYRLPGSLTIQRAQVELDTPGILTQLSLYHRGRDPQSWMFLAVDEVYQLQFGNQWLESGLLSFSRHRAREVRITTSPALSSAPKLKLAYRPDYLVFLAQGAAPFTLAAGNARAFAHTDSDLIDQVLRKTHAQFGSQWLPPLVALGRKEVAAGDAALAPQTPPRDWKSWLLWGLLILGAGVVIAMVMSLMRSGEKERSN